MATRTVRLDEEAEKTLATLKRVTGLSISEVLKRGLLSYKIEALKEATETPYDIYRRIDLGEGGDAVAPASEAKSAVADAIKRKHSR